MSNTTTLEENMQGINHVAMDTYGHLVWQYNVTKKRVTERTRNMLGERIDEFNDIVSGVMNEHLFPQYDAIVNFYNTSKCIVE